MPPEQRFTFDEIPELYDRSRPRYPGKPTIPEPAVELGIRIALGSEPIRQALSLPKQHHSVRTVVDHRPIRTRLQTLRTSDNRYREAVLTGLRSYLEAFAESLSGCNQDLPMNRLVSDPDPMVIRGIKYVGIRKWDNAAEHFQAKVIPGINSWRTATDETD